MDEFSRGELLVALKYAPMVGSKSKAIVSVWVRRAKGLPVMNSKGSCNSFVKW